MKNFIVAGLLFCFSMSFAQLSVRNDSYVFVKDQILFVNDDVNIEEATAKIYLRDESQLIQGAGITGNSGEGQLSVYQEGNTNQWSYNYWCSPIGNNSSANGNEDGRVELLKDATNIASAGDPLGLTSWEDPIFTQGFNGTASPLTISDRWLWTYQTSNVYAGWVYVGSDGAIAPGLGFTMKGSGTGVTGNTAYDFRGKPNNGTINNNVSENLNTLVGNPYPSAMDSAAFIHDPENAGAIKATLFYWEQYGGIPSHALQDYIGGYSAFTIDPSGAIISNAPAVFSKYDEQDNVLPLPPGPTTGSKRAQRYIPIGQGFMVEGSVGTSGIVKAKNAHRVFEKESGSESAFFRNSDADTDEPVGIQFQENGLSIVPLDYKRFRINVEFTVNESKYVRQMLLNFNDNATMSHDRGLELHRSSNLNSDAYFMQEDEIFSGLAYPFSEELAIPLVVDIEQNQPLRFRIFDIQNFDESQGIYMHDLESDIYVNLRNQDYDLNIEPGNYTDRFEIVFRSEAILDVDAYDISSLIINQNNGIHQLSVLNPKNLDITAIEVYDISGKRLVNGAYDAVLTHYELSTTNLSDGVYIVNVKSKTNAIKSQKVIIKN
jgi:hypothetical protein